MSERAACCLLVLRVDSRARSATALEDAWTGASARPGVSLSDQPITGSESDITLTSRVSSPPKCVRALSYKLILIYTVAVFAIFETAD